MATHRVKEQDTERRQRERTYSSSGIASRGIKSGTKVVKTSHRSSLLLRIEVRVYKIRISAGRSASGLLLASFGSVRGHMAAVA